MGYHMIFYNVIKMKMVLKLILIIPFFICIYNNLINFINFRN